MSNLGRGPLDDITYQISRSGPCGSREEDFISNFLTLSYVKLISPRAGPFLARGHNLNNLGRGPLDDITYKILKL